MAVVYARGDVLVRTVVVDRQLFVFTLFPRLVRRPGRLASDHENDAPMAPVRKDDPTFEEGEKAVLARRAKRACRGEFPKRKGLLAVGQRRDDAGMLSAVVVLPWPVDGVADGEGIDCFIGNAVA